MVRVSLRSDCLWYVPVLYEKLFSQFYLSPDIEDMLNCQQVVDE